MTDLNPIHAVAGAIALAADGQPPAEIQWMPPGKTTITAWRQGKPVTLEVDARPEAVPLLNGVIAATQAQGRRAYFDFEHSGGKASAWPVEFFWAGEDSKAGGIRARVEWSASGRAAVSGKDYRQFSPSFFPDKKTGRVTGAPSNMGGLINDPAFAGIEPLWSRHGGGDATNPEKHMTTEEQLAAIAKQLGDLTATVQTVAAAQAKNDTALAAIQARSGADKGTQATDDPRLVKLEASITKLTEAISARDATQAKATAEAHWQAAVTAGRVAPQDEATKKFWIDSITVNAAAAEVLAKLPVNPAFKDITGGGRRGVSAAGGGHAFEVKARQHATDQKVDYVTACAAVAQTEPELYQAYVLTVAPRA